jgi:hypothetical protein
MNQPSRFGQSGLKPLFAADFLLSTLATRDGKRSTAQLVTDLKSYLPTERAFAAFQGLVKDGYATSETGRAKLTKSGADRVGTLFGKLPSAKAGRQHLERIVWPACVLGLAPNSKAAVRLKTGENLRAVALTAVLGLPLNKDGVTLSSAISALLLRALVGASTTCISDEALKSKVKSLGDLSDLDALRRGLTLLGLSLSAEAFPQPKEEDKADLDAFAQRVQIVTDALSTPPFSHKVAISQVYDAYGKKHPDAGRLETFKARLLSANMSGALRLYPLDEPAALDPDTRTRSLVETRHGRYHFVGRSPS